MGLETTRPRSRRQITGDKVLAWISFPSELGWMASAWDGVQLCVLTFGHRSGTAALSALQSRCRHRLAEEPSEALRPFSERMQAFAQGKRDDFRDVKVALDGMTKFQRKVIRQCRRIPPGQTVSYGELAVRAGSPKAARAVGNVMAKNRIPLVIPCHRVVGCNGALGGFSAPDGLRMKRRLLLLEQAQLHSPVVQTSQQGLQAPSL